jgi:hypothetical protein
MSSPKNSLSIEEAEELLRKKWDITLYDKTQLEPGVAAVLANHPGPLDLYSLKKLSMDDAQSLAQHRGRLHLRDLCFISDEALRALAKHEGPLNIRCPEELSEAQAAALGQHKGSLYLKGVQRLSAAVASQLARHEGPLYLNDVRTLSLPAAEALSDHQGPLYLLQVSEVSDEVAEALVRHQGHVGIFPLAEMSEKARSILKEQRTRLCEEEGLPLRSEFEKLNGTFQPVQAGVNSGWSFIYYPRLPTPDPVLVSVNWRSDLMQDPNKRLPVELPDWFGSLLPRIGECIEKLCLEPLPYGDSNAYLLSADVVLDSSGLAFHGVIIYTVDTEGLYWEICVHGPSLPTEFHIDCWGGAHLQSADYLSHIPFNHSIHESTLEGLKLWQKNTVERARELTAEPDSPQPTSTP